MSALNASRKRLKPFYATYSEENRVVGGSRSGGGIPGWGTENSKLEVVAAVDADSSSLFYKRMSQPGNGKELENTAGGEHIYFNNGDTAYNFIEGGMRGGFGSHASGMVNPAAAAYEVEGMPAEKFFKNNKYSTSEMGVFTSDKYASRNFEFQNLNGQTVLRAEHATNEMHRDTHVTVTEWVDYQGMKYPKVVVVQLKNEKGSTERTYRLLKIHTDKKGPLKVAFREGALIRDEDKRIVYNVKDGKLIADPVFNREVAGDTTVRRIGFIAAILTLVVWVLLRLRSKGKAVSSKSLSAG